ncbi:MAG: tetratricopeptide repeat protein [Candidatus Omnitrophota bacterium]
MKTFIEGCVLGIAFLVFVFVGWTKLPVFLYNQGNEYFDKQQYGRARIFFQRSIAVNPSIAVVQYSLGNTYQHLGDDTAAIPYFKKAMYLDPRFMLPYRSLASIYSNRALYDDALAVLADALTSGGGSEIESLVESITLEYVAFELNEAADAYLSGDHARAYDHARKAIRIKNDYSYAYYTLGFFLYADKNYEDAQQFLERAVRLDPQMWLAQLIRGDIAFERAEYQAAVTFYRAAVSVWHESAALYNNLGLSYMNLERYDEAIDPLQNAVRLEPGNTVIRYSLASVYRDSGRAFDALREYEIVVREQPDFPNVHNDIAAIYENLGKVEDSHREYAQEIENAQLRLRVNAQDPVALTSLAYAYCGSGLFEKAHARVQQALRISPDYREAYLALAQIYNKTNRPAEALAALEKAKKLGKHAGFITAQIMTKERDLSALKNDPLRFRPTHLIVLRNGGRLRGAIKEDLPDRILLETQVGSSRGVITLYRNAIERISAAE